MDPERLKKKKRYRFLVGSQEMFEISLNQTSEIDFSFRELSFDVHEHEKLHLTLLITPKAFVQRE